MLLSIRDSVPARDCRRLVGLATLLATALVPSLAGAAPASDDEAIDVDLSDFDPDEEEAEEKADPSPPPAEAVVPEPAPNDDTTDGDVTVDFPDEDIDTATPTVSIIGEPEALPRVVGSAHTVDAEVLEREEHDDMHRVLQSVPGVYLRGEDGFGLRPNIGLRGVDSNRSSKITLMEDGVLFGPAPYSAPAAYYFPLATRMVGIEVFKGPAAVRFGPNTVGGAINLKTREIPRELETGVDIAAGTWAYGKLHAHAGKSWKRFGILFEGARIRSNGFKELDGGGDTGFRKNEFMLKARLHGDPGARVYQQFDVKLGLSTELSNETYLGLTDDDFAENPYRRYRASALDQMDWYRTQAQAGYFVAAGIVEYQSTLYRHDFSRAWTKFNRFSGDLAPAPYDLFQDPEGGANPIYLAVLRGEVDSTGDDNLLIGTNQRDFVSQGWQNTVRVSPKTKHVDQTIEFGARLHFDRVSRLEDEDEFQMVAGTPSLVTGTRQIVNLNRGEALAGSFHVADEITIVDRVTVSPGARVEVIRTEFDDRTPGQAEFATSSVDAAFLPGIGLYVAATRWLGVLAGVHSGFSPQAPQSTNTTGAERSLNYEAGLRTSYKGFRAEGIAFVNDYSNLVSNCGSSQGCERENASAQFSGGEVLTAGAESLAGYRVDLTGGGWIDTMATYTFTQTSFGGSFSSANPLLSEVEEGDEMPYVPKHVAALTFAGGMKRWGTHAQLHFNGQMRDVPGQGPIPAAERIDRFVTLDLGGNVFLTKRAQLYLNLGNATRASYAVSRRPFGIRPGARFSLIGGFKYNW